jgi:hypothetical protein
MPEKVYRVSPDESARLRMKCLESEIERHRNVMPSAADLVKNATIFANFVLGLKDEA